MEKDNNITEKKQYFNIDNIPRCPECKLIASYKLHYKEGKPIINYFCENNHNGDMPLDDYMQKYNNHSLLKQKCEECNKNQNEVKGDFSFCCKCNKFLCNPCIANHSNIENHNSINYNRYDSYCKIHSNFYGFYCKKCNKNLCIYCYPLHESHELINLSKFNYNDDSKKKLEDNIRNIEKKIIDIDIIKEEILLEIDKLKKSYELEIKFFKLLIHTYKYEESQNNMNYNVIQNLKNFEEIFGLNQIKLYEKIFKEGKKYITFLHNISAKIDQTNLLTTNVKTLNEHTSTIYHLSQLKDGRLISCSNDIP